MKAEIYNHRVWISETDPKMIKKYFDNLLYICDFDVLDFIDYRFVPMGYTAVWLLGESHFAIHTFPEHQKTYIEMSSCNIEKHNKFIDLVNTDYGQK
tara:strand:- start:422 stop:712 length:291 start_codon:yes stop_codon:yes gene_type:complete